MTVGVETAPRTSRTGVRGHTNRTVRPTRPREGGGSYHTLPISSTPPTPVTPGVPGVPYPTSGSETHPVPNPLIGVVTVSFFRFPLPVPKIPPTPRYVTYTPPSCERPHRCLRVGVSRMFYSPVGPRARTPESAPRRSPSRFRSTRPRHADGHRWVPSGARKGLLEGLQGLIGEALGATG